METHCDDDKLEEAAQAIDWKSKGWEYADAPTAITVPVPAHQRRTRVVIVVSDHRPAAQLGVFSKVCLVLSLEKNNSQLAPVPQQVDRRLTWLSTNAIEV